MSPDPLTLAAAEQARNVAVQMMVERGRGHSSTGVSRRTSSAAERERKLPTGHSHNVRLY